MLFSGHKRCCGHSEIFQLPIAWLLPFRITFNDVPPRDQRRAGGRALATSRLFGALGAATAQADAVVEEQRLKKRLEAAEAHRAKKQREFEEATAAVAALGVNAKKLRGAGGGDNAITRPCRVVNGALVAQPRPTGSNSCWLAATALCVHRMACRAREMLPPDQLASPSSLRRRVGPRLRRQAPARPHRQVRARRL